MTCLAQKANNFSITECLTTFAHGVSAVIAVAVILGIMLLVPFAFIRRASRFNSQRFDCLAYVPKAFDLAHATTASQQLPR